MKQYLNSDQTAKLIGLGFEKPKSIEAYRDGHYVPFVEQQLVYSIGELIEMLPDYASIWDTHHPDTMEKQWVVGYLWAGNNVVKPELIDALYDMIVGLKKDE